jgi:transcriptional regulator with XRE-family HTH domain
MPTRPKKLHHRLRTLRQARGLTQAQAATRLGVPRSTLSKWETGLLDMSFASIETICNGLQVEPGELLVLLTPHAPRHGRRCTVEPPGTCPYCTPSVPSR